MSFAKRMDALKARGFNFTVDAKYNFQAEKRFNVTLPDGTELRGQFDSIVEAVHFCEGL